MEEIHQPQDQHNNDNNNIDLSKTTIFEPTDVIKIMTSKYLYSKREYDRIEELIKQLNDLKEKDEYLTGENIHLLKQLIFASDMHLKTVIDIELFINKQRFKYIHDNHNYHMTRKCILIHTMNKKTQNSTSHFLEEKLISMIRNKSRLGQIYTFHDWGMILGSFLKNCLDPKIHKFEWLKDCIECNKNKCSVIVLPQLGYNLPNAESRFDPCCCLNRSSHCNCNPEILDKCLECLCKYIIQYWDSTNNEIIEKGDYSNAYNALFTCYKEDCKGQICFFQLVDLQVVEENQEKPKPLTLSIGDYKSLQNSIEFLDRLRSQYIESVNQDEAESPSSSLSTSTVTKKLDSKISSPKSPSLKKTIKKKDPNKIPTKSCSVCGEIGHYKQQHSGEKIKQKFQNEKEVVSSKEK